MVEPKNEGSLPVPNLAEECTKKLNYCFTLPGTDIEVSVARVEKTEKHPLIGCIDFMVYFRRKGTIHPNIGFLHIKTKEREASWSVEGVKL